ncbi:HAD family phosphatase [Myxococcota bacterium]|nr:HAD family phosphatase [Myxococcota bacterium]
MDRFGVVFDLDGLLVDSERLQARAFAVALSPFGIVLDDREFGRFVGLSTRQNFLDLARMHPRLADHLEEIHARKDRAYRELVEREMEPMPGARTLVEALHRDGIPMAVASSSPRADVAASLARAGLSGFLDRIVAGDEVARPKPAPDLYLRAAELAGLPPWQCVALEDARAGVEAAKAAGLSCVAIPNRYTRDHDFSRADLVLPSLEHVSRSLLASLAKNRSPGSRT